MGAGGRLDGWKAIAAFFGKDRTTVARWARERNLPIHQIPGGKQKSVFAFEDELAEWALTNVESSAGLPAPAMSPDTDKPTPAAAPDDAQPHEAAGERPPAAFAPFPVITTPRAGLPRWRTAIGGIATILAIGIAAWLAISRVDAARDEHRTMPRSPRVAADYVAARDAWGQRTAPDLQRAIRLYARVIQQEPDFAPARAGLAEAWLIIREYGDVGDARAFSAARIAAQRAIDLDPNLGSGHRALGFVNYWWDNDPTSALREYKIALKLDGTDAQTHFWYANILADMGASAAAERHYARAKLLDPGSQSIAIEYACAQWQAGRDKLALRLLTDLRRRYPKDATIENCLTWVYIGLGDMAGASRAYDDLAALRKEPQLVSLAAQLRAAVAANPATAHRTLIADAEREIALGTRRIREVPAFYASAMGDRTALLGLLQQAFVQGEQWYSPSITKRIAARWHKDAHIMRLLHHVRMQPPGFDSL